MEQFPATSDPEDMPETPLITFDCLTDAEREQGMQEIEVGDSMKVVALPALSSRQFFIGTRQLMTEEAYKQRILPLHTTSNRLVVILDAADAYDPFVYTEQEWLAFIDGAKKNEFDSLLEDRQPPSS